MATIDSISFLISLLCFIALLTSSVSAVAEPDGTSSALLSESQDSPSISSLAAIGRHPHDDVGDKNLSKYPSRTPMMAEGGPILVSTSSQQQANTKTAIEPDIPNETRERKNILTERYVMSSVVPRKGVEEKKVKARKGVSQSGLDAEQGTTSTSQTTLENIKPIMEGTATAAPAHVSDQAETLKVNIPKLNNTNSRLNDNSDHYGANSSSISAPMNASISHTEVTNDMTLQKSSFPVDKKHIPKPKPTVTTVGKSEINESRLPSRNKSSPLGTPRKIDYIVPVIITIVALPILGTAIFVLYRRGRDCWDKRHYRRMDFLIDGMYND